MLHSVQGADPIAATADVLDGYEIRRGADSQGFVWAAGADWLSALLAAGRTLHAWASAHDDGVSCAGRGAVHAVPAPALGPGGQERWAVRHYRRGGAVARYLDDRYLAVGDSRPMRELKASVEARRRGVPTPSVVGGAVYRSGMFYRADLATEFIPDAVSLADLLFGNEVSQVDAAVALHLAGRIVRTLESTRVLHPDTSAGNILLRVHLGDVEAYVIDLDRCSVLPLAAGDPRPFMRERLERSLRKLGARHAVELPGSAWQALRDGFEVSP